jgi:sterol 3beta-glucosyltransferase
MIFSLFFFSSFISTAPSTYKPPKDLEDFMTKNDPRPLVYVGFGSIVVADPDGLTAMVFSALKAANVRAILVKGWGGLGKGIEVPENVFQINAIPHEWLFPQTAAVVHHGGAGTSAIGMRCGKPTIIVPFFGDQYFWGQRVAELGVGTYINNKNLTTNNLAEAIKYCTTNQSVLANAKKLGEQIM